MGSFQRRADRTVPDQRYLCVFTLYLQSVSQREEDESCLLILAAILVLWGLMPSVFLALYKMFSCIRDFPADVSCQFPTCLWCNVTIWCPTQHASSEKPDNVPCSHPHPTLMFSTPKAVFIRAAKEKRSLCVSRTRCYLNILSARTFETCLLD